MQLRFCGYCRWILYVSLLLLIVSCQTETAVQGQVVVPETTLEESQTSELEQPVEPYNADRTFVDTGVDGYEKIVVQPEDLGWPSVSYVFVETPEWLVAPKAIESYSSDLSPFYNPVNPKTGYLNVHSPFGVSQFLNIFATEEDAIAEFETFNLRLVGGESSQFSPNFIPQLDNMDFVCHGTGEGPNIINCIVVMQYGRFVTNGGMLVNDEMTTFKDWENFLIAMQARLIAYVEEEKQNQ